MTKRLNFAGHIARIFQDHPLTPILAIAGLLIGLSALMITPREEQPQVDVTMVNVTVPFPGAGARDVEALVTSPLEQQLAGMKGVDHVMSVSRPGVAMITVQFEVGVPRQTALVRLYNQVFTNLDLWPDNLGVGQPLIRARGIDDVPVMALTLWSEDPAIGRTGLAKVAHTLEVNLQRVPGSRDVFTIGAPERTVVVELDAGKLAVYGLSVERLMDSLRAANVVMQAGHRITDNQVVPVTAGTFLADASAVAQLVIGLADGEPVRLADVARIDRGADTPSAYVWFGTPPGASGPNTGIAPAVTLAITLLPGSNAADLTTAVRHRIDALRGVVIPDHVHVVVTRNYGQTSTHKAMTLIKKLVFATLSVVLLVLLALGWREAIVVGTAVILTLALMMFASWAFGFTINRVSLFALIFSIGILVDDAIVVVENIHRHMALGEHDLRKAIPAAVSEVGGPTILATFTVIAALLPMAFVTGLMGPYMRPIPINASAGMLLSLAVALVVTPWLALKLLRRHSPQRPPEDGPRETRLLRFFRWLMRPFVAGGRAALRRRLLFAGMGVLVLASISLVAVQAVVLKMLPFDNKPQFQVVVNMPEGTTLQTTNRVLKEMARALDSVPAVASYEGYAGTHAPITFNGLVRQYYLRSAPNMGGLHVNLVGRDKRDRESHAIAQAVLPMLTRIGARYGAAVKVVEVPPGPPVQAPIVAEIYGPDYETLRHIAVELEAMFHTNPDVVNIDSSVEADAPREVIVVDRARAARLGVNQADIARAIRMALAGIDATYLMTGHSRHAIPVRLRLAPGAQASLDELLDLRVRSRSGALVPLSAVVNVRQVGWQKAIYHKDLRPYTFVTANGAGATDSPLYEMFTMVARINDPDTRLAGHRVEQNFISQPTDVVGYTIKWSGAWEITYETFRDMGIAYIAGLVLIYLLVVGHFRRYMVPLIIMAPIPLTVIGVMPGHALLDAQFTATSMIGMIALAGIIVRNSILLIDFVDLALAAGRPLGDAVIEAAAVRAKPIALTALAAMIGGFFILDDPIFEGLAVSLIFGILVSTVLTLVVIPLLYYAWLSRGKHRTQGDAS